MDSKRQKALERMRAKAAKKLGSSQRDPSEFRPKRAEQGKEHNYYFFVLPPVDEEDVFFLPNGFHYINNRYMQCPRVNEDKDCPVCQMAFDMLEGVEDQKQRSAIAKKYLPNKKYAVNILFTNDSVNGDLAGKVMWYNAPMTVFKKMQDAFMRDDEGDDPHKPKAFGDFFNPKDAYIFNLTVTEKGGYPNYEQSDFLGKSEPIPDADKALSDRHDLYSKFPAADTKGLQDFVDKALHGYEDDDDDEDTTQSRRESTTTTTTESKETETPSATTETKEATTETENSTDSSGESDESQGDSGDEDPELKKLMADIRKGAI